MRLVIAESVRDNDIVLMRKIGYSPHENFQGKVGFVRRTGNLPFPRFHIYLEPKNPVGLFLSIHFDAKRESYLPGRTHALEVEGEVLNNEARRIYSILKMEYSNVGLVKTSI